MKGRQARCRSLCLHKLGKGDIVIEALVLIRHQTSKAATSMGDKVMQSHADS